MSLQDLADKIVSKFSSIHAGRGYVKNRKLSVNLIANIMLIHVRSSSTLSIKHLETDWGDILDLADDTVGDIFDDRQPSGENRTSIVKVARFPPDPSDLRHAERFASLLPESSARPRKRPFPQSPPRLQDDSRQFRQNEGWVSERPWGSHETANKRPRTFEGRPHGAFDSDQPLPSLENRVTTTYHSSQIPGTQESVNQVYDSQTSPPKKRSSFCITHVAKLITWIDPNPYGTPTSLPQDRLPNQPNAAIPDSPSGRRRLVVNVDRESTKSESPELRLSVHQVPPANSAPVQKDQTEQHRQIVEPAGQFDQHSTRFPSDGWAERPSLLSSRHVQQDWGYPPNHVGHQPEIFRLASDPAHGKDSRELSNARRKDEDVYDPIESDTESFRDKQRMHNAKRLRLSRPPSHDYALPPAPAPRPVHRNGDFLVPAVPKPRLNSSVNKNEELNSLGDGDTPIPLDDGFQQLIRAAASHEKSKIQSRDRGFPKITTSSGNHGLSITEYDSPRNQSNPSQHLFEHQAASLVYPTPFQATTTQWTSENHGIINAKSSKLFSDEEIRVQDEALSPEQDFSALEVNRVTKEPEEQQEEKAVREKKAEDQRLAKEAKEQELAKQKAEEARATEEEEEAVSRAHARKVAQKAKAREEKARIDEQAEADGAEQIKEMEEQLALKDRAQAQQADQDEQTRAENKRLSDARRAKDKEVREKDLAEQAERMMLAVDGAKQLELEKAQKSATSAPSKVKEATPEAPRMLKHRQGTPDQKARRKEKEAQRKAEQLKAAEERKASEEKRAFEQARTLAEANAKDDEKNGAHAKLVSQKEKTPRGQLKSESVDRNVQRYRNSSEARSSPSSLTPVLPGVVMRTPSVSRTNGVSSDTLDSKSGHMDAPPRSALRQTSSAMRRSVSFQDDHPLPGPAFGSDSSISAQLSQTSQTTAVRSMKSLIEINHELAAKAPLSSKPAIMIENKNDGKPARTPIYTRGKVQTRLNVTRDKKMKGRAVDPPSPAKPAPKQELVISSDEDSVSSYYSDEEEGTTANARAGPSSKKKPALADPSQEETHVTPSSSIDPALQTIKPAQSRTTIPVSNLSSSGASSSAASSASPQQKSISRSPARSVSESSSSSSGTQSGTESEAEIVYSSRKTQVGVDHLTPAPSQQVESSSKARQRKMPATDGAMSSQSSHAASSRSQSVVSTSSSNARRADRAADTQLQLETKQSLASTQPSVPPSKTQALPTSEDAPNTTPNVSATQLTHNGLRPANYRYPTMTELKRAAAANTPPRRQSLDRLPPIGGSQRQPPITGIEFNVTSSDENSSSSSSDSDGDDAKTSTHPETKPKSAFSIPGMKGLMKRMFSSSA